MGRCNVFLSAILGGLLVACAQALAPLQQKILSEQFRSGIDNAANGVQYLGEPVLPQWFLQKRDHFNWEDTRTFKQRYFVNDTFFRPGSEAPIFLCVGGEGPPLDGMVVVNSVHCNDMVELAPKIGALLVAIEHRYYGESVPTEDLSTPNLEWLSSKQALADLAHFHAFFCEKFGLTEKNKWVTWGGSYPGMLAGWARLKYPHLFHAAVASSAPVKAQVDFHGYLNTVADALAEPLIGGSQACLQVVSDGHARIGELMKTPEGRNDVADLFNVCGGGDALSDWKSQQSFAGFGVIPIDIQGNNPQCKGDGCNVEKLCDMLLAVPSDTPIKALARVSTKLFRHECRNVARPDANGDTEEDQLLMSTDKTNDDRVWSYQTCTEFAFFQTCEIGSRCPFAQGYLPLQKYLDTCQKAFNISSQQVREAVQFTNEYFGSDRPRGYRIMYPNGSVDPWSALGVRSSPNRDAEPTLWVLGASHHAWTHPYSPDDQLTVIAARKAIWTQVTSWLEQE